MALYDWAKDAIALAAATAKTVVEVQTASTDRVKVKEIFVGFDGVNAAAVPVLVELLRGGAGITGTTLAATARDPADGAHSCTIKHTATAEGSPTAASGSTWRIPPTGFLYLQVPLGNEWVIGVSGFWRIRLTAAAIVNATVGLLLEE